MARVKVSIVRVSDNGNGTATVVLQHRETISGTRDRFQSFSLIIGPDHPLASAQPGTEHIIDGHWTGSGNFSFEGYVSAA